MSGISGNEKENLLRTWQNTKKRATIVTYNSKAILSHSLSTAITLVISERIYHECHAEQGHVENGTKNHQIKSVMFTDKNNATKQVP